MKTPQYITDEKGKKLSVILPLKEYQKMLEDLEELEDIRLYDEAMAGSEGSIPVDEAFQRIEAKRNRK
jgi:hypothetical protein